MTMLAYTLNNILELIPEVLPLVKQASVDEEFPIDNRNSVLASALQLKYFEKIAYEPVDFTTLEKVAFAVKTYGMKEEVDKLSTKMVKAAEDLKTKTSASSNEAYLLKVANFEYRLPNLSIEDRSLEATTLYKESKERNIPASESVVLYSGHGFLNKEAAIKSLSVRYNTTKDTNFVKIASALGIQFSKANGSGMSTDILTTLSNTICKMDKEAGLNFQGHNFYKEAFFVKEADYKSSLNVCLAGKEYPYESLERVGKSNIANYIGVDVAAEMNSDPDVFKNVIETLPLDLQRILVSLIQNV